MTSTKTIIVLLTFIVNFISAQKIEITEKNLFNVFKKTINKESKSSIRTVSNPWITDNSKGDFAKLDTIVFTNGKRNNYVRMLTGLSIEKINSSELMETIAKNHQLIQ